MLVLIFPAGNEGPIHFPSHPPLWQTCLGFDCHNYLATQLRLHKCHAYLMLHHRYLTKDIFFFFVNWNHASYFIRHSESLQPVVRWSRMFYSCPLNICLSGCQKSSGSPRTPARLLVNELWSEDSKQPVRASPERSFGPISGGNKCLGWSKWKATPHTLGCLFFLKTNKNCLVWFSDSEKKPSIISWVFSQLSVSFFFFFWHCCSLWLLVSLSHWRLMPTGGKESDH